MPDAAAGFEIVPSFRRFGLQVFLLKLMRLKLSRMHRDQNETFSLVVAALAFPCAPTI